MLFFNIALMKIFFTTYEETSHEPLEIAVSTLQSIATYIWVVVRLYIET